jgi:hypothetical protein
MEAEISTAILLPLHRSTRFRGTQDWTVNRHSYDNLKCSNVRHATRPKLCIKNYSSLTSFLFFCMSNVLSF